MSMLIDRKRLKAEVRQLLTTAEVNPRLFTALYLLLSSLLPSLILTATAAGSVAAGEVDLLSTFISILLTLISQVLGAGFAMYCMAIRSGQRAEYVSLFDGFSFVGKIIALVIVMNFFIMLWSMLFFFPGVVAMYRYRFALYNLYEDPTISVFQALEMSKRQTYGLKAQLFTLDLTYLGWALLASVPALWFGGAAGAQAVIAGAAANGVMVPPAVQPSLLWMLVSTVWTMAVSIFYVANYQCVDLGYFEAAKDATGVGFGRRPYGRDDGQGFGGQQNG